MEGADPARAQPAVVELGQPAAAGPMTQPGAAALEPPVAGGTKPGAARPGGPLAAGQGGGVVAAAAQPGVEAAQQPSVEGCQGGVSADDVSEGPASVLARLQQQDSHASDTSDAAKPLAAGMEVEQVGGGEAVAEVAPGAEEAPGTEGTV
ncbi:hypothetical protein CHLRE_06g305516v5 [Chlamydomonas reinhardtii]|nr:uncharacterized protein CHLRE_06g305516v5 [Chlamydomonas reinhardtii]PNW83068.1 hypothetical protein CHLRE_06g305516v5 [Chlamydomonas reinhardtii]